MKNEIEPSTFILASLLSGYPQEEFGEQVAILLRDAGVELDETLGGNLEEIISTAQGLNDLRSDYISIFDNSKSLNPLYETEYGRERAMFKARELSDIAAFYKAFGFDLANEEGIREMPDHISVELEFYSLMKIKLLALQEKGDQEGIEIVQDAMKKFLQDHLGRFTSSIIERPGVQEHQLYNRIFTWIDQIVKCECQNLGVQTDKIEWILSQVENENMCCGTSAITNK